MILETSEIPFSGHIFKETVLNITYSIGRASCADPLFDNTLTIGFYDISKNEENFELTVERCSESEKMKKAILDVPVPKNK
jgi:hypothetical protein